MQDYRVHVLKDQLGANAWRTAHHPVTGALLDACDRQGLLVWNENHRNKVQPKSYLEDLQKLIRRDRNHPSVFVWSICNERLCCPGKGPCSFGDVDVALTAKQLVTEIKRLDPHGQRVTSAACNADDLESSRDFLDSLDLIGINYHLSSYDHARALFPDKPIIVSEASSDYSTRGEYMTRGLYVRSYDTEYPSWGSTAEQSWCNVSSRPFVAGQFFWTGFDYKGEPTPYAEWPSLNSHFGNVDLTGFPKDNAFYHASVFRKPTLPPSTFGEQAASSSTTTGISFPLPASCRPTMVGGFAGRRTRAISRWTSTNSRMFDIWVYSN
ncbi:unnamed protein product [Amoebophrya sp. A25]|nr:unnamed protein product [Amoebophrya sp. A25]|eukprot:GSA25T00020220001.1